MDPVAVRRRGRPADDAEWRIDPDETTEAILTSYRAEHERCRTVIHGAEPDDIARRPDYREREFSLRWMLLHLIEETARHNGHADVLREAIDGQTGE